MERARSSVIGDVWKAVWTSRLVVWAAGLLGEVWFGQLPGSQQFDPTGLTRPFSPGVDLLLAPAARWDSVWYLSIAKDGYRDASGEIAKAAFYPLYPLLIKAVGWIVHSALIGGLLVSLACFLGALILLRRLAEIELGERDARGTVLLVAFFPAAFFFSAVYAESLFLLLSVGTLLMARRGRWAGAGVLGALAALTRNSGVLLLLPVLIMFLWGPRGDRPDAGPAGSWWRPRHPLTPQLLWLCLIPLGLVAYLVYIGIELGDPFAPFAAQELWARHFAPLGGVWEGARAAWLGLRQLLHGERLPVYFPEAGGDPFANAGQNLMLFGFLVFGVVALVGALRRLPFAYGAYAGAALAVALSYPVSAQPLMSLPRFVLVLFPFQMWLARWAGERGGGVERAVAISAVLLGLLTAQFARWGFVA